MNRMFAKIQAIESYFPNENLKLVELNEKFPNWNTKKIVDKTGIKSINKSSKNQYSSNLAYNAAKQLIEKNGIAASSIECLILCTQSPDYLIPTTACLVQHQLGLSKDTACFDINLGCSGYVYCLGVAKGLIETGQVKNVLLITADTYTKFLHPADKTCRPIFGDGATGTLIISEELTKENIGPFIYGTDGSGKDNLIMKKGGVRSLDTSEINDKANCLYMNGPEIFKFTLLSIPPLVRNLSKKSGISLNEFDFFIFHQANKFMLEALRASINIDKNKFLISLENCGNTVSSTIPQTISANFNKFQKGDKIMVVGFGVGYSWAAAVINW